MKKKTLFLLLPISILLALAMLLISCGISDINDNHNQSDIVEQLVEVMPESGGFFEEIDISTLGLSEKITNVYKELSNKGYVFRVVSEGYNPGMVVMVGVSVDGKITGSKCLETYDTTGKEIEIDNSYNGQSFADFSPIIIAEATRTSIGYRDAVDLALQSFILISTNSHNLKIDLESKVSEFAPGFANLTAIEASGSFQKILKASNDSGFAYISSTGANAFLVLVNATGGYGVYDVEGNNVTKEQMALAEEAKAHAVANQKSYIRALESKIRRLFTDCSDIISIEIPTFNTIVSAASFKSNGEEYYGFYSRSIGFDQMDVYVILDANGAIAKVDAERFIFDEEYFTAFGGMNNGKYKAGFEGLTSETWTGDAAIIATATMSSNAMNQSVKDVFESFACINK